MRSVSNPPEISPHNRLTYRRYLSAIRNKLPRAVVAQRQRAAQEYLDSTKAQFGYRPVCVYQIKDLWTHTDIDPPGALVSFEELPALFQVKLATLMATQPFLIIPGVGMRLNSDSLNQGHNYWLETHEKEMP